MEIKGYFDHFNINVVDLERSIAFYNKALGLREIRRKDAGHGGGPFPHVPAHGRCGAVRKDEARV